MIARVIQRVLSAAVLAAGVAGGCAGPYASEPPTTVTATSIAVGQPWSDATAGAILAGYELHDASQLAMDPAPDGFYIDMPGRRGLLVTRDRTRNGDGDGDGDGDAVRSVTWIENWPGPKGPRVYHGVQSYAVPPADAHAAPPPRRPHADAGRE